MVAFSPFIPGQDPGGVGSFHNPILACTIRGKQASAQRSTLRRSSFIIFPPSSQKRSNNQTNLSPLSQPNKAPIMDAQQAASHVQLDDEGDLVLLVRGLGKTWPGASSFLVSSKILSLASRVFAAMLSPRFAEGRQLQEARQQGPDQRSIIPLKEDDVVAMDFILSVIHFKADRLQSPLTAKEIANIAVHSDKYDFNGSLTPWITEWCDHHRFPVNARHRLRDMGYGILAAYLFRSPQLETMSAHFLKIMPPDFAETWKKDKLMEHLPEDIWSK
jgi:hypothetical protein